MRAAPVDVTDRLACRFWIQDKANRDSDFDSALQQKITSLVENRAKKKVAEKTPAPRRPETNTRPGRTPYHQAVPSSKICARLDCPTPVTIPVPLTSSGVRLCCGAGSKVYNGISGSWNHEAVGLRLARADIQSADPHTMACVSSLAIVQG